MAKRIGKPSLRFDDVPSKTGPVRQINLPREGSALEGVYAEFAAKSDLTTAPYEALQKENFNRSLVLWTIAAVFWLGIIYVLSAPGI